MSSAQRLIAQPPLFDPAEGEEDARAVLARVFGYSDFRPGQGEIIDAWRCLLYTSRCV